MRTPSDRTVAAWLFVWLTLVYLATAKGVLEYWDDISMLAVTASIVDHGSVAVPASTPGSDPGKDGRSYSQYGIGQSLLAVPFYVAGGLLERYTKPKPPPIIDERFERLLWSPSDSPILAAARSLLRSEYPLDIAPTYYGEGWRWVSHLQLIALLTACATLAAGLLFGASARVSARGVHEARKIAS